VLESFAPPTLLEEPPKKVCVFVSTSLIPLTDFEHPVAVAAATNKTKTLHSALIISHSTSHAR
jgi:hypothetical protein